MSTVGNITLEPHVGQMGVAGKVVEVVHAQWIIMDGTQRLGYVADIDTPPINLIVRVNEEDAADIQRQVDALLGRPTRELHMPAKITARLLHRASVIAGPSGTPYDVEYEEEEEDEYE